MAIRAEIDPLAVLLPTRVFLVLTEIKHPRVDRKAIQKAIQGMSAAERRAAAKRASELAALAGAVKEELEKAAG